MKKLSFILSILLCFSLISCTKNNIKKEEKSVSEFIADNNSVEANNKLNLNINTSFIESNLKNISSNIRNYGSEGEKESSEYIKEKLEEYGYSVDFDDFKVYEQNMKSTISVKNNLDYFKKNPYNSEVLGVGRNIIAKQKNFNKDKKTIYITAHYDSTEDTTGVIDNVSGCSVVLEVARVLKDYNNEFNIGVVLFSGEEYWRTGSRDFVSKLSEDEKEDIIGCINIDMVGEKDAGNLIMQTSNGKHNIISFMLDEILENKLKLAEGGSSDELSFYMGEIPSITITDENSNPDLALKENQLDYIDMEVLKETSEIILEFLTGFKLENYESTLKEDILYRNFNGENNLKAIDRFELIEKRDSFIENGYSVETQYTYQNDSNKYILRERDSKFISEEIQDKFTILNKENNWGYKIEEDLDDNIKILFKVMGSYGEIEGNMNLNQGIEILENYYEQKTGEKINIL